MKEIEYATLSGYSWFSYDKKSHVFTWTICYADGHRDKFDCESMLDVLNMLGEDGWKACMTINDVVYLRRRYQLIN